jgi:hypothetical protein
MLSATVGHCGLHDSAISYRASLRIVNEHEVRVKRREIFTHAVVVSTMIEVSIRPLQMVHAFVPSSKIQVRLMNTRTYVRRTKNTVINGTQIPVVRCE